MRTGQQDPPYQQATIYSPFGLAIVDIAPGQYLYDKARAAGERVVINDFFHERKRW